ncbi:MAG: copper amine oxidase N-terminal domain-containing protein [Anaerovoracaceae bacterium]|jgi:hypothetical protein
MSMSKRIVQVLVIALLVNTALVGSFGAGSGKGSVVFTSKKLYGDNQFVVTLKISNVRFNAFQFVIRYDNSVIIPVDSQGVKTSSFEDFAAKSEGTDWLSTVGTSINTEAGLIDFTGFVNPGSFVRTDGLAKIQGYGNIGKSGIELFTFHFKKVGKGAVRFEVAEKEGDKPYSKFLPEGALMFNGMEKVSFDVLFDILNYGDSGSSGGGGSSPPIVEERVKAVNKRIKESLVFQIGNSKASSKGEIAYIDEENKDVAPFIDENSRTMIPVRFIAESLGASVNWDPKERTVTINLSDRRVVMKIGERNYTINGVGSIMDTAPIIVSGWQRTVVPARFVAEALGRAVEWDEVNKLILITPSDNPWLIDGELEKEATSEILLRITS